MNDNDIGYLEQLPDFLTALVGKCEQRGLPSFYLSKILDDMASIPVFAVGDLDVLRNFDICDKEMADRLCAKTTCGRLFLELGYKANQQVVVHVVDISAQRNSTWAKPILSYGKKMSKRGCFLFTYFVRGNAGWRPRAYSTIVNKLFKEDLPLDDYYSGENVAVVSYQIAAVRVFGNVLTQVAKETSAVIANDKKLAVGSELKNSLSFLNALSTPGVQLWQPSSVKSNTIYDNYFWLVNSGSFVLSYE